MKGRKTWQLGYAAGVIDSDGCITIGRHHKIINGRGYMNYRLEIIVNQTDGRAVEFLYGTFGGFIHRRNQAEGRPFLYRWEIRGESAMKLLKRLIPFLRIKQDQAEVGVRFQSIRESGKPYNQYSGPMNTSRYEELYQRMRHLKTVVVPSAAAETKWNDSRKREAIVQTVTNN